MKLGANYLGNGECEFIVWAPLLDKVAVQIVAPDEQLLPMEKDDKGYWHVKTANITPDTLYTYQLDGQKTRPDPASHFQPKGVHEASQVVDHNAFVWEDGEWQNIPLEDYIVYELHIGTFTPKGTFEAIIDYLPYLKELGVSAIEIMPVAQFPGDRNWGYDGVYPFAVQHSYGGVNGLKQLVNACHKAGIAVILDVIYNHFGPEGNYTADFAPYFTSKHKSPWGNGINYDDAYCYGVRHFVIENVLYWLREYHFDALRLDAADNIFDLGANHVLAEISTNVAKLIEQQGRPFYLFAESDLNDPRMVRPLELGGFGLDVQWCDDFHHCIHALLTKETGGYYLDFGKCEQLAKSLRESFVYTWDYSEFRKRYHGNLVSDRPPCQFLVFSQNHDQVGNRLLGERLTQLVSFEALKLAAGTVLLSPYIPLLFMGEEYGEEAPFYYFVNHSDPELIEAIRKGRKEEFKAFHLEGEFQEANSIETLEKSRLNWELSRQGKHKILLDFYKQLIQLRRQISALRPGKERNIKVFCDEDDKIIMFHRWHENSQVICVLNFNEREVKYTPILPDGKWVKKIDSSDSQWMGNGSNLPNDLIHSQSLMLSSQSFVLYEKALGTGH
jgi:maltooligosyltrehalose trehalohydrolase